MTIYSLSSHSLMFYYAWLSHKYRILVMLHANFERPLPRIINQTIDHKVSLLQISVPRICIKVRRKAKQISK